MGILADAALASGGRVIGVMPQALIDLERGHRNLTERHIVSSMHERKALMEKLSDAFVALPGGYGTLDEFCEILTWAQLGIHKRPCGLLNTNGFWTHLIAMFDHAVREGLLRPQHREMLSVCDRPMELLERMALTPMHYVPKWEISGTSVL